MTQAIAPCAEVAVAPPPPEPRDSNAGGWVLAAVLVVVLIYEAWAAKTKRPTISQWTKRTFRRHRWWRPFAMTLLGLTLWHLFFGGPL